MPLDPVTCTEPALVAVTVRVSDCPAEIVLELGAMETLGAPPVPVPVPVPGPGPEPTVTVVCALELPLPLVAVAV